MAFTALSQSTVKKWGGGEFRDLEKTDQNKDDFMENQGVCNLLRGSLCLLDERMNYYHDTYSTGG